MMVESVTDTSHYFADVKPFFEHNQYIMFVYEKFEDVRVVGAPPRTIGKFGGDTDNWMWPRHTGDFAVLRIYGNAESKPAPYSKKNIAIRPKHHLPISIKGYEKGDYTFVMGFPGGTDRYKTSFGVEALLRYNNSSVITIGDRMLEVYRYFMNSSEATRIQYASKYDRMSNYWKYAIGQNKGIKALDVIGQKVLQEKELVAWILEDSSRQKKYADVLVSLQKHYDTTKGAEYAFNYLNIGLLRAVEFSGLVYATFGLLDAVEANDPVEIAVQKLEMKKTIKDHFKDYNIAVDKAQFIAMSHLLMKYVPEQYHPEHFAIVKKKYKGSFTKYADKVYEKSIFMDKEKILEFVENPDLKTFQKDIGYTVLRSTIMMYYGIDGLIESTDFNETRKTYLEAVLTYNEDSLFYPDANSTIRYTYGYVGDYKPRDGVQYSHYTTLKGVVEKEDSTNHEFVVPQKLITLYENEDYGQYMNEKGELPLCFISNNDITGGNSGSPIMNANGELLGLAFDGNWEAMSGDIIFETEFQKCISVDIRYVLFIIDKFAGASYLIDEMTIVK